MPSAAVSSAQNVFSGFPPAPVALRVDNRHFIVLGRASHDKEAEALEKAVYGHWPLGSWRKSLGFSS